MSSGRPASASLSRSDLGSFVSGLGIIIRYGFYAVGAVVLAMVGIGLFRGLAPRVTILSESPAFRLASAELGRLPAGAQVVTEKRIGRIETRQYGRLYDRDTDLTAILTMPARQIVLGRNFVREMQDIRPLSEARAMLTTTYYDLETRFGEVRAADLNVDADGRRKLCLAFLSRYDTVSLSLKGWYCQANGARPTAQQLACILDSLTLDAPLASGEADAFVRSRMARRPRCAATPVSQTTDTRPRVSPLRRR